ncbi:flagellar assembly protein FliH [Pseudomonas duriflava]|uniref:Flagellar assembly protein FliH n=1 Tax=Pseudomonas duriflava TaxID=459528 RepID=A0A562QB34_9PSED|nr:flagellar assembly protein FliH [Pseudomonas duriflava]TWI53923.1 flagellar assembly protein FliH [Pseudomonas duriflava]
MNKAESTDLIRAKQINVFERWLLPDFDGPQPDLETHIPEPEPEPVIEPSSIEEVPIEEVKPLTLEELEAIRQEAYQEAYNEGFMAGEREGFHSGQVKARQEAEVALKSKLSSLEILMGHLLEPIAQQDRELEQALVRLVGHVSRQVIQRELIQDSSQLRQILREALKLLPMGASNIRIHLSPQDFDLVKALRDRHDEHWKLLEDEALLPGGCRIESEHSVIDASVETRIAQAMTQLAEQQRHQATQPAEPDMHISLEGDADAS